MNPATAALLPEEIVAQSGSNLLIGLACLSARRRAAMTAIYAFCRVADDAVDDAGSLAEGAENLAFWRHELELVELGEPRTAVGSALQQSFRAYGGSAAPLHEFLEGMAMDLGPTDYPDLPALEVYCHRVASVVGLACLPVLGATGAEAETFAKWLGRALQLTNIRRDLRSDAEVGRVYAPRDWLAECGVEVDWLTGRGPAEVYRHDGPVARLCDRFHTTAEERFARVRATLAGMPWRHRRSLVPARIMGAVYRDLLRRLRQRGGDLPGQCTRVPRPTKLWLATGVLLGVRE